MAVCAAMLQAAHPEEGQYQLRFNHFWQHAHHCAALSREIALGMAYAYPQEAFLAGLLHDIGKLLMWANFPKTYGFYFDRGIHPSHIRKMEQRHLSAPYCEIGAHFLDELNLPSFFTDAVRFQQRSMAEIANSLPLVRIVYAAEAMARQDAKPDQMEALAALLSPQLNAAELAAIHQRAAQHFKSACQLLGLMPSDFTHHHVFNRLEKFYPVRTMLSEVEEMSLVPGLLNRLIKAREPEIAYRFFLLGLHILFDVHEALYFQFDNNRQRLVVCAANSGLIGSSAEGLVIPLSEGRNLPSFALINNRILDSFGYFTERSLSIADQQLIVALGRDGMICVPLQRGGRYLGLIAGGIREVQIPRLAAHIDRLQEFADHAAVFLDGRLPEPAITSPPRGHSVLKESVRKVIHEVNNPLGIIKNYLGTIGGEDTSGQPNHAALNLIQDEIDRVARLIERLGQEAGSSPSLHVIEQVDLNRILIDLHRLLDPSVFQPAGVKIHYNLASDLPPLHGDANALIQVFLNLFKNAVEAMPQGGRIRVQTVFRRLADKRRRRQIIVTIRDSGPGLTSAAQKLIFKPGISSKSMASGGLGLAIVKDIIEQHGGTVFFQNQRGKGTTVIILLPIKDTGNHRISGGQHG
jgi:signal transduction histidine kinase